MSHHALMGEKPGKHCFDEEGAERSREQNGRD